MNTALRRELTVLSGMAALGCLITRQKGLAGLFGLVAAGLSLLPSPTYAFNGKSVVITGGSRGLGLALAEQFLIEGCNVILIARDQEELERAKAILVNEGRVHTIQCDITEPDALKAAFEEAESRFGHLDLLVNNAGTITVGPFKSLNQDDFEALITLQLKAVVNAIQLALPAFNRAGGGCIVNISSIGGALPVPHMSNYCAGKFAIAGLSETLNAELAEDNVHVMTVYPGLMRTGSPIQAVFKGNHEKEYAWFTVGDVSPFISVTARYAAQRILEGIRNQDTQVVFPWITKASILGRSIFPETYAIVMRLANRLLPSSTSTTRKTGAESESWLDRQIWYKPFKKTLEKAEAQFNQHKKYDAEFNLGVKQSSVSLN